MLTARILCGTVALIVLLSGRASAQDGNWTITNNPVGAFAAMAATPGVVPLIGDFNNDGRHDIALLRRAGGWASVPIAFAQGNGSWSITNRDVGAFAAMAATPGVVPLIGDFNNDGRHDIALLRRAGGWASVPIAFAQGDGNWTITNNPVGAFAAMAATPGVVPLIGDFNNDGRDDIALLRQTSGWASVPIAFAQGDGSWSITNREVGAFAIWATESGVIPLAGDYNNDGRDDIALLRRAGGWASVPIAFAQGDGTWSITNRDARQFAEMAATPGVVPVTRGAASPTKSGHCTYLALTEDPNLIFGCQVPDFNNDGRDDIALLRQASGWASVPIAFAQGDGSWSITNRGVGAFAGWAANPE